MDVTVRITKGGCKTTHLLIVRVYRYYAAISEAEEASLGQSTFIQCNAPNLNLPQLFEGALSLASAASGVLGNYCLLANLPVFPGMSTGGKRDTVIYTRLRTPSEINGRLTRNLRRIGLDLVIGQRAVRTYGFRRGGTQDLLD